MSKGLEALNIIKGTYQHLKLLSCGEQKAFNDIEKELKALEVIKREPSAVIETITTYDTWEEYTKDYPISDRTIWHIIKNKEEFDLLREVLL